MIIEIIGDSHLALFYPLPFFRLESINKVLADSEKYNE